MRDAGRRVTIASVVCVLLLVVVALVWNHRAGQSRSLHSPVADRAREPSHDGERRPAPSHQANALPSRVGDSEEQFQGMADTLTGLADIAELHVVQAECLRRHWRESLHEFTLTIRGKKEGVISEAQKSGGELWTLALRDLLKPGKAFRHDQDILALQSLAMRRVAEAADDVLIESFMSAAGISIAASDFEEEHEELETGHRATVLRYRGESGPEVPRRFRMLLTPSQAATLDVASLREKWMRKCASTVSLWIAREYVKGGALESALPPDAAAAFVDAPSRATLLAVLKPLAVIEIGVPLLRTEENLDTIIDLRRSGVFVKSIGRQSGSGGSQTRYAPANLPVGRSSGSPVPPQAVSKIQGYYSENRISGLSMCEITIDDTGTPTAASDIHLVWSDAERTFFVRSTGHELPSAPFAGAHEAYYDGSVLTVRGDDGVMRRTGVGYPPVGDDVGVRLSRKLAEAFHDRVVEAGDVQHAVFTFFSDTRTGRMTSYYVRPDNCALVRTRTLTLTPGGLRICVRKVTEVFSERQAAEELVAVASALEARGEPPGPRLRSACGTAADAAGKNGSTTARAGIGVGSAVGLQMRLGLGWKEPGRRYSK